MVLSILPGALLGNTAELFIRNEDILFNLYVHSSAVRWVVAREVWEFDVD